MNEFYRVLIVDDDSGQAEMLAEFLRISGSFQVERVGSLRSLWDRLDAGGYDIILLDYMLPDGTGLDALERIAEQYRLPVVMVTGQGDERVAVQAIQRGATDYLVKTGDYLVTIPALIRKTVRAHELQLSVQRSVEQIRYQAVLLNNVRDAIVVWDLDGSITYWNPAAEALFGWSAAERLGKPVTEVYLTTFVPPIAQPKDGDTLGFNVVRQCQTRSRGLIWVSSRVTALREAASGSRLIGYMDVSHDITKLKEAEQALRAERNFVSAVLDTVGALVVVLDREGRVVRFNRACEETVGYLFAEVRGKYVWDFMLPPEESEPFRSLFQNLEGGEGFPNEHESHVLTRSGSVRLVSWSNTALTSREGQVEFLIATGIDITEQRVAEQALRESETRYRAIVDDYQTELIFRFSPGGTLTFVNEVYSRYFQQSREDLVGKSLLSFLPDGERSRMLQHLADFSAEQPTHTIELQVILPDGETRWHQWTNRAIFDEQGCVREFQSVGRDITERKQMEAQIQAAQTQLTQATRLATIGELASGIAHQINNPLTTIIAEAQILLRKPEAFPDERDSIEAIEQAGWRLQEAVQRLLEFSRPATATLELLPVSATIESALLLVGAHIEAAGVRLETGLQPNLPEVRGNRRQLEDLWVNLLLLARDACANNAPHMIRIETAASDGQVLVSVRDDGQPIPPDQLDLVFEPNFVEPTSGRGTGLELSICREIVRQHGGEITAESTPERDTIFRVALPAGSEAAAGRTVGAGAVISGGMSR